MNNIDLKPVKGIEAWARKQFRGNKFIYYRRKGNYAECHCAECGEKYVLRATETGDPFKDMALNVEKPERDMQTVCRKCKTKAIYKPADHTRSKYDFCRIVFGQKIDDDCGLIDYYIAAARYPDFEMIIKMGLIKYADNLVRKIPVNPNPRGKNIEDRLRINKERIKSLIDHKGEKKTLEIYQLERRMRKHWTEEELEIVTELKEITFCTDWEKAFKVLKYMSPIRLKNYMRKQRMWIPGDKATWQERSRCENLRREYFDYIHMRINEGYDMTNDIILFPADFRRRRDEMLLMIEKAKADKRKAEVLEKFPKIKEKYRRLSEKYAAAADGYIIRPARDAAEIVEEGRLLHHCVGGDNYLRSHNDGRSFILFLRKADSMDIPFITIEIRGEEILQWYGAYDKKPNKKAVDAWLKKYIKGLAKMEAAGKKAKAEKGVA